MITKTQKGDFLDKLLRYKNTVFSTRDIALIWQERNSIAFRVRLNSYVKNGKLLRLKQGIYAKDINYSKEEFATKISVPSYISLETVLLREAVSFQYYSQIFVVTNKNLSLKVDGQKYELRKMPVHILLNKKGINQVGNYNIASKERALLDVMYLHKYSYFDNLRGIDWEKIDEILPIYKSKRVEKIIKKIREQPKVIDGGYYEFLKKLVKILNEQAGENMLESLGELLENDKDKLWVKNKLHGQALFLLKLVSKTEEE